MLRPSLLALVVLASCSGDDVEVGEGWGPVTYIAEIDKEADVPFALTRRIDGTAGTEVLRRYEDEDSFADARITFELLDGDTVVDTLTMSPAEQSRTCPAIEGKTTFRHHACSFANGELRFSNFDRGGCTGDAFCIPRCHVLGPECATGTHCGASFATAALTHSRTACIPNGSRTYLESCSFTAGSDGRYHDDCGAGHACVDGTCRRLCASSGCADGETCVRPPAHAPELTVCLPPPS